MRIDFERTGGFSGMTMSSSFNLDELSKNDADNLRTLIEKSDFSKLPEKLSDNNNIPDQFTYTISVQSQEWEHTVITGDSSAPEDVRLLIETLNQLARTNRK